MSKSIHVNIENEETWNEFKAFVENKHGKLHTVMGIELNRAIKMYLADQAKPQGSTHTHKENEPKSNTNLEQKKLPIAKFETVKEEFLNNAGDTETFQRLYAERLVKEHLGRDPRTVEKYCSELKDIWMLK